jgi:two-component sensor histidine kinase
MDMPMENVSACASLPHWTVRRDWSTLWSGQGKLSAGENSVAGQKISSRRSALRIVSLYAVFGLVWILLSDQLLTILAPRAEVYRLLQSVKGGGFVVSTGLLLYLLIRSEVQRNARLLAHRDALLKELDHRVKNNLQVVLSLLSIHKRPDEGTSSSLESQIRTIAAAHDLLGSGDDPALIRLGDHLQAVLRQCSHAPILPVSSQNALNALLIRVDQAVPLGLVIHEVACDAVPGAEVAVRWSEVQDEGSQDRAIRLTLETRGHSDGSFSSQLLSACLDQVTGSVENTDGRIIVNVSLPVFSGTRPGARTRQSLRFSRSL